MRWIGIFCVCWLCSSYGWAICEYALDTEQSQGFLKAIPFYEQCAVSMNNDEVQLRLAKAYHSGSGGVHKNMQKALLFYHLSSENGNAIAQTELAQLLLNMDEKPSTRAQLQSYLEKIKHFISGDNVTTFDGSFLHPYALLALAVESIDQKWYYVSDQLSAPQASGLLKKYKVSDEKKRLALDQMKQWKERKMIEVAREIYQPDEYQDFVQRVKPISGYADAFLKSQSIQKLKTDIKAYKEQ